MTEPATKRSSRASGVLLALSAWCLAAAVAAAIHPEASAFASTGISGRTGPDRSHRDSARARRIAAQRDAASLTAVVVPGVVVVKRRDGALARANEARWKSLLSRAGAMSIEPRHPAHASDGSELSAVREVRLAPGTDVHQAAGILRSDPAVEWAEPVFPRTLTYTPDDPQIGSQWYLATIRAAQAWDTFRSSSGVVIAVVDNGIYQLHPDLGLNVWANTAETGSNGIDDDRNGYIDDVRGWDFSNRDNNANPSSTIDNDDKWHGTSVAAIANAITDNGVGMAAPAFNAKVMPVKCAPDDDPRHPNTGDQGIVYAADNGADIINCSFGSSVYSDAEKEAVAYAVGKGLLIVASAGNSGSDEPNYPSGLPGVMSVASTGPSDGLSDFSSYGPSVDLCAPGEDMYTADGSLGYGRMDGTSFSSPLTVSVASLVLAFHPGWTPRQAGEQVRISATPIDDLNPLYAQGLGSGRLNAERALAVASPSVRIENYSFSEGPGANGDGVFDPGETLLLTVEATNFLEPANDVRVSFSSNNPDVTFPDGALSVGRLNTLETWSNGQDPLRVNIGAAASRGQEVVLTASIQATGGYDDRSELRFVISNSYATIESGNARLTVASNGRLGSADIDLEQGEGFVFGNAGDILFEGAFMAAVSAEAVSDVARGVDVEAPQNADFGNVPGGEIVIKVPGPLADQQGLTVFSDAIADAPLGLTVSLTALAFTNPPDEDYVLLAYRLINPTGNPIVGLYTGLFMDWDVTGLQSSSENMAGFDPVLSLAYIDEPMSGTHGGLAVVSEGGASAYKLIKNKDEVYPEAGGFSDEEKWICLSGGIRNTVPDEPEDYSHVLGTGPVDLAPDDTVLVGYAVVGGKGLAELQENAAAAQARWRALFETSGAEPDPPGAPLAFRLEANFPNPFNPETTVRYSVAERGPVRISVTDVRGREIARLVDTVQGPGRYEARWNGTTQHGPAPSGVYILRMTAGDYVRSGKMVLVK